MAATTSTRFSLPPIPPLTPSPKLRIHRSQSFDSPSHRFSAPTPLDDAPFSKSTSAISAPNLPRYNALRNPLALTSKMSDESLLSSASSASTSTSKSSSSSLPRSASDPPTFTLYSGSPSPTHPSHFSSPTASPSSSPAPLLPPSLAMYQDPSVPSYDPWLVRVVLDLYDVRGCDWTMIAEPIWRVWGWRTSSGEVLGILSGNGRVGRRWWD